MFSREYGSPGIRPLLVSSWDWVAVANTRNTQNVGDGWKSDVGSRKSNEMVATVKPETNLKDKIFYSSWHIATVDKK